MRSYSIYLTSVIPLFLSITHTISSHESPPGLNIFLAMLIVTLVGAATYSWVERPITRYILRRYQQTRMAPQLGG